MKETLFNMGHRSICIYFYTFDRALWASVGRILERWHHLMIEKEVPQEFLVKFFLMCWVVMAPCGAHDMHNALRWGMLCFENPMGTFSFFYWLLRFGKIVYLKQSEVFEAFVKLSSVRKSLRA